MTAIIPKPGNTIAPNPKEPIPFPMLLFAALIVAAGIHLMDQVTSKGSWLLAFLVLLVVAFSYKEFGDEITKLFSLPPQGQQTSVASGQILPGQQGPLPVVTPTTNVESAGV